MLMNDMTDDGKWGAAIPIVDGKRPEWLGDYAGPLKWYNVDQRHGVVIDNCENLNWGKYYNTNHGEVTTIRLPADHPHYQQTQTQTLTAQERLEKYEGLLRRIAASDIPIGEYIDIKNGARALVAEMEPVVDGDVIAVRKIMHAQQRAMTPPDSGWGNMSYLKGSYDHTEPFKAALAAYQEQRP